MSNQNQNQAKTKRDYFEPSAVETSIIAAAAALTGPNDHPDWSGQMLMNIREVATMARDWKFRDAVAELLDEDAAPFVAVVRGFEFHESSQRYVLQLEARGDLEYINTNRTDSDPSVELMIDLIDEELIGHNVLIYKLIEAKGKNKYRSLGHIKDLGPGEESEFSPEQLEDELAEHVASIGKSKSRR